MANFFKSLLNKLTNKAEIDWDELESDLISADLGIQFTVSLIDELQELGRKVSAEDVVQSAKASILSQLPEGKDFFQDAPSGTKVILMVGINGTGKTTSSAKLANYLKKQGHSVRLAAADTFRAAAVEQLQKWGARLDIPVVTGTPNSDPSSVCYVAHQQALAEKDDYLICDTAGRIHTNNNLMKELEKIHRTLKKQDESAPFLSLMVVDGSTGNNAKLQAQEFKKAAPLDGLIVTKLDGSGKGGVILPIYKELGLAPLFLGTGEEPEQFERFEKERFVETLL